MGWSSLSLPVLAVPSLLVMCWFLILTSFSWSSFGTCPTPQGADAAHTISRKLENQAKEHIFLLSLESPFACLKVGGMLESKREVRACIARTGQVRPLRSRELLNHLSHLPDLSLMVRRALSLGAGPWVAGWTLSCIAWCPRHRYAPLSTVDTTGGAEEGRAWNSPREEGCKPLNCPFLVGAVFCARGSFPKNNRGMDCTDSTNAPLNCYCQINMSLNTISFLWDL